MSLELLAFSWGRPEMLLGTWARAITVAGKRWGLEGSGQETLSQA